MTHEDVNAALKRLKRDAGGVEGIRAQSIHASDIFLKLLVSGSHCMVHWSDSSYHQGWKFC